VWFADRIEIVFGNLGWLFGALRHVECMELGRCAMVIDCDGCGWRVKCINRVQVEKLGVRLVRGKVWCIACFYGFYHFGESRSNLRCAVALSIFVSRLTLQ
jgi:hypothetical protein